jgi:hypothetical protein
MKVQITAEAVAAPRKEAMGGDAEANCFLGLARPIGASVIEDGVKAVRSFRTPVAKRQIDALCLYAHFQCDRFVRDRRAARGCDARAFLPSASSIPANPFRAFHEAVCERRPGDAAVADASGMFDT